MKLLHINSSVLGPHSVSRQVSAAIVERLRQSTPGLDVSYRDLTLTPLAHLTGSHLAAGQGATPDASLREDIAAGQAVLEEFLAAEIIVLGAPMYNFTIPSQLKAWIDRILVAGKTFKYSAQGVEGLAAGKRVIVAISRGGFYGPGTPAAVGEHLETYLRWVFGFIGIRNPEFISADGIQVGPEHREKAVAGALKAARRSERRLSFGRERLPLPYLTAAARSENAVHAEQHDNQGAQETDTGKLCDRSKLSGVRMLRRRRRDARGFRHDGAPVLCWQELLCSKCPLATRRVQCAFWLSANPPQVPKPAGNR